MNRFRAVAAAALLILLFAAPRSGADTDFYPVTASDRAFFEHVRKAVLADDIEQFSEAVSFPIVLRSGGKELKLENKRDFKQHAALILTTRLKSVVRKQSPDSLFKNWQGVMIGQGEIWFSEVEETGQGNGQVTKMQRIIAINQVPDKSPPKK